MPKSLFDKYYFPDFIKGKQRKLLCSMVDLAYLCTHKKHYKKSRWLKKYKRMEYQILNIKIYSKKEKNNE